MTIEPEIFGKLVNKMIDYTFRKQVDINYCSVAGRMTENQIKETVKYWSVLNEMSYVDRYKGEVFENFHELIDYTYRGQSPNTYQTLKWLECIQYNIEMNTIKSGVIKNSLKQEDMRGWNSSVIIPNPLKTLTRMIDEIKSAIIKEIPQYEEAKWNSIN